jgi:diguanylate cyclase (GGDEF)-like protein
MNLIQSEAGPHLVNSATKILLNYLGDLIYCPDKARLNVNSLPDDFRDLGRGFLVLQNALRELRDFTSALGQGNLAAEPPKNNELASPLKNLHANLRHLTWQSQQVAMGDYSQRVQFMGEFAEAFNSMITQLDERQHFLMKEIDKSKIRTQALEELAFCDPFTKTNNRFFGMRTLRSWVEARLHFCICFVDIDYLKYVNDVFGHSAGDEYIITVANLLSGFSGDALVSRLGGDEFMLLQRNWNEQSVEDRLWQLRSDLEQQETEQDYTQSISYGVVEVPPDNTVPASDLLSAADEKMYEFKRSFKKQRTSAA